MTVTVPLSRCSYAQLAQQPFEPPRVRALPPPDHPSHKPALLGAKLTAGLEMLYWRAAPARNEGARAHSRASGEPQAAAGDALPAATGALRAAHAAGVEVGLADSAPGRAHAGPMSRQGQPSIAPGPHANRAPQEGGDPEWAAFLAALQRSGFFAGAEAGSARWGELRTQALAGFWEEGAAQRAAAALADVARRVDEVLLTPPQPERLEQVQ